MFQFQVWFLPFLTLAITTALAIPFSRYLAWIMDGRYRAPRFLRWIEARVDTGPQNWKQYAVSMLLFNTLMFVFGFAVLSLQPFMPLNPDGKHMLAPDHDLQLGDFVPDEHEPSALLGRAAPFLLQPVVLRLLEHVRIGQRGILLFGSDHPRLRSESHMGNFYLDMWRVCAYTFVPACVGHRACCSWPMACP